MSEFDVDLFVIGAGSGGVRAARDRGRPRRQGRWWPRNSASAAPASSAAACRRSSTSTPAAFADEFEDAAGFGWTRADADVRLAGRSSPPRRSEITRLSGLYRDRPEQGRRARSSRRAPRSRGRMPCVSADGGEPSRRATSWSRRADGPCWSPSFPGLEHAITSERDLRSAGIPAAAAGRRRRLYRGRVRQRSSRGSAPR